jgi:hypothetical protein
VCNTLCIGCIVLYISLNVFCLSVATYLIYWLPCIIFMCCNVFHLFGAMHFMSICNLFAARVRVAWMQCHSETSPHSKQRQHTSVMHTILNVVVAFHRSMLGRVDLSPCSWPNISSILTIRCKLPSTSNSWDQRDRPWGCETLLTYI